MLENHGSDEDILPKGHLLSNRYLLESFLGSGGMGSVYLALDTLLEDKIVAIKVLHKEFARDSELTRRFLREVNMMHSVNHPNVVRTFDAGVEKGLFYFTMEYIEGLLLDSYLEEAGRDYNLLGRITAQICKGLEAIHEQNIVHRDLKPGNILVSSSGYVKITDFGVARPISSGNTAHREIMGSLDYIPPEVFLGNEITPASDFYSLGVILYGIVTGHFPFEAEDPMAIVWKHVHEQAVPPRSVSGDVPEWLDFLIMRLLRKDPEERPSDAREIIRYVREQVYKKDGELLDSGSYQTPSESIIREFKREDYEIFDTDNFELNIDTEAIDHEINFDDNDSPSALLTEEQDEFDSRVHEGGEFQSACHQLIFDALPTVDAIREHEKEWEAKKRLRVDDLGSSSDHLIRKGEKSSDAEKLRTAIKAAGIICALAIFMAFGVPTYLGQLHQQREKEESAKTIQELREEYLSGKANQGATSSGERKRASSGSRKASTKKKGVFDTLFSGADRQSTATSFSRLQSITNGDNGSELPGQAKTVFQTGRDSVKAKDKGVVDVVLNLFGLNKKSKNNTQVAPIDAQTVWSTRADASTVDKKEVNRIYSSREKQRFSVDEILRKKPELKNILGEISSDFSQDTDIGKLEAPSSREQKIISQKEKLRKELSIVDARLKAYNLSNERSLAKSEIESNQILASIKDTIRGLIGDVSGQLERQGLLSSFLNNGEIEDVASIAEKLSDADAEVARQFEDYKEVDIRYRQILDKIRSGEANSDDKKEGRAIGAQLSREREKLRAKVQSKLSHSMKEGYRDLMNSSYAVNVLRDKESEISDSQAIVGEQWGQIKLNGRGDKKTLESKKNQLMQDLNELNAKLSHQRELEIKKMLSVETLGN
jgi:serine/threonine protein kinase